jgi:hypothetical protein
MLTEIRKALDNASTQHEWDTDGTFIEWKDGHPLRGTHRRIAITDARVAESFKNENRENDAHLIVNTPKYLEWCLSEITALQQQNKQLIEALVIVRDTLACKKHDDRTSHGLWKVADKAIQGGTPDASNNNA